MLSGYLLVYGPPVVRPRNIVPHGFSGTEVPRVDYEKLSSDRLGESSASIRERVQAARERQRVRFEGTDIVFPAQEPGLAQLRYARGGSAQVLYRPKLMMG